MGEPRWVTIETSEPGLRTLTLNRPPVNALSREFVAELAAAFERLAGDEQARCLIVRSAGKHFCAGADLKERQTMTLEEVRDYVPRLSALGQALADLPFPTLAAIRGAAAGGGCEMVLACDLRLLSDDATIGLRETALAIIPGAGGTQRLPRLIGPSRAKRWIFSAAMCTAEQALADGVADRVVPADDLDHETAELARAIAANGPVAVRLAKKAIRQGLELPLARALELEWECYQGVLGTRDREEALRAFAEKRPPDFKGR